MLNDRKGGNINLLYFFKLMILVCLNAFLIQFLFLTLTVPSKCLSSEEMIRQHLCHSLELGAMISLAKFLALYLFTIHHCICIVFHNQRWIN